MTHYLTKLAVIAQIAFGTVADRVRDTERERGATAVEYGLLVALIAAVIIGVVVTLGGQISAAFTRVSSQL